MVFANHAHLFPACVKEYGDLTHLISFLDECSIDKAVCFAPFSNQIESTNIIVNQNVWLANEIKDSNRLVGFGTIDFEKNIEDQVKEALSFIHHIRNSLSTEMMHSVFMLWLRN